MARGIGGEDGPTLWMFVAVVLVWGTVSKWLSSAKNTVVEGLEIGKNSAGPLQAETTAEIRTMEDQVASWHCAWSELKKPKTFYQNIADKLWKEIASQFNIDEAAMIAACRGLSKNELMAVAKCFGVREAAVFGLTTWTGHIFKAFDVALEGMFKKNELAEMHRIWAVTKLW